MSQSIPDVKPVDVKPIKTRFWFNNQHPLWMPEGSVRAILILGLAGTMAGILLKFAATHEEIPKSVSDIMSQLLPALVLLVQNYFNARKNGNGGSNEPTSPAH